MNKEYTYIGKLVMPENKNNEVKFKNASSCDYELQLKDGGTFYISQKLDDIYYSPRNEIDIEIFDISKGKKLLHRSGLLRRNVNALGFYEYCVNDDGEDICLETVLFDNVGKDLEITFRSDLEVQTYAK